jgi:hypothetical protein
MRPIAWGFPLPGDVAAIDAGTIDVVFGGCVVTDDDPTHECRACGHRARLGLAGGSGTPPDQA